MLAVLDRSFDASEAALRHEASAWETNSGITMENVSSKSSPRSFPRKSNKSAVINNRNVKVPVGKQSHVTTLELDGLDSRPKVLYQQVIDRAGPNNRDSPIHLSRGDAARRLRALSSHKSLRSEARSPSRSSSSSSSSSWSSLSNVSITKALDSVRKNKWERLYAAIVRAKNEGERLQVDEWKDSKGSPALSVAAALDHVDTLLVLYGVGGANVEEPNHNGFTPLAIAAKYGSLGAVKTLLKFGASPSSRNVNGDTPLIIAANQIHKAVKRRDEKRYKDLLEICFRLVQRQNAIGNDYVEAFTRQDDEKKRIRSAKARTMIKEWIRSKKTMRDLHMPSMSTFRDSPKQLKSYFESKHADFDFETWAKIAVLLIFVYYDFVYGPRNVKLYILLYVLAYAL